MTAFLICGRRYSGDDPGLGRAAALAHALHDRPRCLCCADAPAMYVARAGYRFTIKRMPNTRTSHAPGCPSRHEALRYGSRASHGTRANPSTMRDPDPALSARSRSLLDLLQTLWRSSGLTRWHPAFEGRRSWAIVRRRLLMATERLERDDLPGVWVPETFSLARQEAIRSRRAAQWSRLGERFATLTLVGELKRMEPLPGGFEAMVKHLPDVPLWIGDELFRMVAQVYERELALWNPSTDMHMAISAELDPSSTPMPTLCCLALLPLTRQWLPVRESAEFAAVNGRSHAGRRFTVGADAPRQ